jgi:hypothetical protein
MTKSILARSFSLSHCYQGARFFKDNDDFSTGNNAYVAGDAAETVC